MTESLRDKRNAERVRFRSRIVIHAEDTDLEATAESRDISVMGVYIHTDSMLPTGTKCRLSITLTGNSSEMHLDLAGLICRHDATGMGITFTDLDVDNFVHLKNLVLLHKALDNNEG